MSAGAASYPSTPAVDRTAAGLAAWTAARWLASGDASERPDGFGDPPLTGVMWAIEWGLSMGIGEHYVHQVPLCSVCFDHPPPPGEAP